MNLEARVARIEAYIERTEFNSKIAAMNAALRVKFMYVRAVLISGYITLIILMAHGFHWI